MQSTAEEDEAELQARKENQPIAMINQQEQNNTDVDMHEIGNDLSTDVDILEAMSVHLTGSAERQPLAALQNVNLSPKPLQVRERLLEIATTIKLPTPEDAKLEANNGRLVLSWRHNLSQMSLECEYSGILYQSEGRIPVYTFRSKKKSISFLENLCNPVLYYYGEVVAEPVGNCTSVKSEPCKSNRKKLCEMLEAKVFIDDSSCLRTGYKVYKGYIKGARPDDLEQIAVKLLGDENYREIKNLQKLTSTPHENIVSFRASGKVKGVGRNMYVAMELCHEDSLYEIVKKGTLRSNLKKILVHIMRGLCYIHEKKILHRDLKPQNVLRSLDGRTIKLADFGLSKEFKQGMSKVSKSAREVGTDGWGSPEHYDGDTSEMSEAADIFSAGLVACFLLSDGKHAFGEDEYRWKVNIIERQPVVLPHLVCNEPKLAEGMIRNMLKYEPSRRPSAEQVLCHPFFWNSRRKLDFVHRVWEFLGPFVKKNNPKPTDAISDQILVDLEEDKSIIKASAQLPDWRQKMKESGNREFLVKKANGEIPPIKLVYQSDSVIELLRFIRNIEEHFREHDELMTLFKNERKNIWPIFADSFPDLLLHVFEAFYRHWPGIQECPEFSSDLLQFFTTPATYKRFKPFEEPAIQEIPKKRRKRSNT